MPLGRGRRTGPSGDLGPMRPRLGRPILRGLGRFGPGNLEEDDMTMITPSRLLAALAAGGLLAAAPVGVSFSSGALSLAPAAALAKHGADDRTKERHGRGADDRKGDDRGRGGHGRDD